MSPIVLPLPGIDAIMVIQVRAEKTGDFTQISTVHDLAFEGTQESNLVTALRNTPSYIPALSLVAENEKEIIGHILFTKAVIEGKNRSTETLALAPISVHPSWQKMGAGTKLVRKGLEIAQQLGFLSVVVLGHSDYYPRFGFRKASDWHIEAPWPVPDEVFMALELKNDALQGAGGTVRFAAPFSVF